MTREHVDRQPHDVTRSERAAYDVWRTFATRVASVRRLTEALMIATTVVTRDAAPYYSNFRFFLMSGFMVPPAASPMECAVYEDLVHRLGVVGDIPIAEATRIRAYLI